MHDIFNIIGITLSNTPAWVYLLFIFLVYIGVKARRANIVPLPRVFILPLVFVLTSGHMLANIATQKFFQFGMGILALIVGVIAGWWVVVRLTIKVDKQHRLIEVPGSWSVLIVILFVFISNYYCQVVTHAYPTIAKQSWFIISSLAVLEIGKGYFIGRALALWRCFRKPRIVTDLSIDLELRR